MTSQKQNSFPKKDRLSGTKRIDNLFSSRESFIAYPLRIVYSQKETNETFNNASIAMLVSVSKRKFKRAVKRNRVKRLIREVYRLNKTSFAQMCINNNISIDIAFLYLKNELPDFQEIEKAIAKTLSILNERLNVNSIQNE